MNVTAQLIGYPRIGPNRELKWELERAWSGRMEADAFAARIAELRQAHLHRPAGRNSRSIPAAAGVGRRGSDEPRPPWLRDERGIHRDPVVIASARPVQSI